MPIIIIIILAIYVIAITWSWQNLGEIDKKKKVITIVIGILITYLVTLITFNISKMSVEYTKTLENSSYIKNIVVLLFTGINILIFIPQISKILDKINENEIEKDKASKKFLILFIVFIICLIFECSYMKSIQNGILNVYNLNKIKG